MLKMIARLWLGLAGWRKEGARPTDPKFVYIAAPHTSNWDFVYLILFAALYDLKISWMGKHSLFRPPFGAVMRALGGIPIERHHKTNVVSQMARAFAEADTLALVVPAEGTRAYVSHWKSGFYHIARAAEVPIVLGFLDYRRRRGGFGPAIRPTGDVAADMAKIREFYADKTGKYPERFGEVRLRDSGGSD